MFSSICFVINFLQEKKREGKMPIRVAAGGKTSKARVPKTEHNQQKGLINVMQE